MKLTRRWNDKMDSILCTAALLGWEITFEDYTHYKTYFLKKGEMSISLNLECRGEVAVLHLIKESIIIKRVDTMEEGNEYVYDSLLNIL